MLTRDTLFTGVYLQSLSDLHPDGDRLIVPQPSADIGGSGEYVLAVNWFAELRERLGEN